MNNFRSDGVNSVNSALMSSDIEMDASLPVHRSSDASSLPSNRNPPSRSLNNLGRKSSVRNHKPALKGTVLSSYFQMFFFIAVSYFPIEPETSNDGQKVAIIGIISSVTDDLYSVDATGESFALRADNLKWKLIKGDKVSIIKFNLFKI